MYCKKALHHGPIYATLPARTMPVETRSTLNTDGPAQPVGILLRAVLDAVLYTVVAFVSTIVSVASVMKELTLLQHTRAGRE